jgi:hypothetical protein
MNIVYFDPNSFVLFTLWINSVLLHPRRYGPIKVELLLIKTSEIRTKVCFTTGEVNTKAAGSM